DLPPSSSSAPALVVNNNNDNTNNNNNKLPRTPRGRTRGEVLPKGGESSRLTASPHFSMETPRGSRACSPDPGAAREPSSGQGSGGAAGVNIGTPQVEGSQPGADADLQYEWQFEILNNLPRDTALALVDHIRASENERATAARLAEELRRTNSELQTRLREKERLQRNQGGRRALPQGVIFCSLLLLLLALGLALGGHLERRQVLAKLDALRDFILSAEDEGDSTSIYDSGSGGNSRALSALEVEARNDDVRGRDLHQELVLKDGKVVRETTVREMMLRETTTREFDKAEQIKVIKAENLQMKLQLERLWIDIDSAVHKGEDQVCWKV
ncbi:unnamed protein product, partial [Polarella glacialis]